MKRILAWSEMLVLFVLLYAGIPWAGLTIDGFLRIPAWPSPVRWIGLILLVVGLAGLAWCFALFVRFGRWTPNPSMPPTALVMVGPYRWTRNPIALSHAAALFGLSLLLGSVSAAGTGRSGSDRKSTRLNSSHVAISYAVFCLKKKM